MAALRRRSHATAPGIPSIDRRNSWPGPLLGEVELVDPALLLPFANPAAGRLAGAIMARAGRAFAVPDCYRPFEDELDALRAVFGDSPGPARRWTRWLTRWGISRESANRILGSQGTDLLACSFCHRSQKEVGKATAGPAVYICDSCGRLATETATTERASKGHSAHMMSIPRASDEHSCSFCAKERAQVDSLVSAQTGETIGNECLELCGEIKTGSASAAAGL